MIKRLLKDSVIYGLPSIFSRSIAVILLPLYAITLNPRDFGTLDLIIAFSTLVNLTVAFEVSQGLFRFYLDEKNNLLKIKLFSTTFIFTIFTYFIFCSISLIYSDKLSMLIITRNDFDAGFMVAILYIFFNGLIYLIQNQLRCEFLTKSYSLMNFTQVLLTSLFSVVSILVLKLGLFGLILSMLIGSIVPFFYGMWVLRRSFKFIFDFTLLKKLLIYSAPLLPGSISVFFCSYADRLMINHYLTLSDVGFYGVAFRVSSIIGIIFVGFQSGLTPLIFARHDKQKTRDDLAKIFSYFITLSLLGYLLMAVFAKDIIETIATREYSPAAELILFIVPAILFSQMYIFAPGISIAKKTYLILIANVVGACLNLISCWYLLPLLGLMGAGLSLLISYFFVFLIYMFFSQRFYFVPHNWKNIIKFAIIVITLIFIILEINLSLLLRIFINLPILLMLITLAHKLNLISLTELKKYIFKVINIR